MTELEPLRPGLWPALFMTATVPIEGGTDALWISLDRKRHQTFFAAKGTVRGEPELVMTVERRDEDHARLRFFVVPPSEDDDLEVERTPRRRRSAPPVVSFDDLLSRVASAARPARVPFDSILTIELDPTEYRTKLPLPVKLWVAADAVLEDLVGARFRYTRRGVSESWIAIDLIEDQIRVQVHFEKRLDVSVRSVVLAWTDAVTIARRVLVKGEEL